MGSRFARFRGWTKKVLGRDGFPVPARRGLRATVSDDFTGFVELEDRSVPATFVVTNTLDSQVDTVGGLSLRQAILAANANPGFDRIEFNIPTSPALPTLPDDPQGQQRYFPIVLATTLPDLTDPAGVLIDGTTQPRNVPLPPPPATTDPNFPLDDPTYKFNITRPIVQILPDPNPGAFPTQTGAFNITGQNNTIRGLVITGFAGAGINLTGPGATNNQILDDWINTDITGKQSWINDPIIQQARQPGLLDSLANNDLDVLAGITLTSGANHNIIGGVSDLSGQPLVDAGGDVVGAGGVISTYKIGGNGLEKDQTLTITADLNKNVISGTPEFRKDSILYVPKGSNTAIPRARDIAGAASGPGVRIQDPGTEFNLLQNNYIGTDATGTTAIPNVNGIEIYNSADSNYIGNPQVPGSGNLIKFNQHDGIRVAPYPNPSEVDPLPPPPPPGSVGSPRLEAYEFRNTGRALGAKPAVSNFGPQGSGAPFFDEFNPDYFTGGTPQGGNILQLTNSAGGFPQVGVDSQVGTKVTIRGANLSGATSVAFTGANGGLAQAKFTVASDTEIDAIIPAGAVTGPIQITTPNGVFPSAGQFAPIAVILPSPKPQVDISSEFFPSSGVVGQTVTIVGQNFDGAQQVLFGGVPSSSFHVVTDANGAPVVDAAGNESLQAVIPVGAKTGPISVVTPGGGAATTQNFTVQTEPPPIIAGPDDGSGNPTSGITDLSGQPLTQAAPGQLILIHGSGFIGTYLAIFSFSPGGGYPTSDLKVLDANTIEVRVPRSARPPGPGSARTTGSG